MRGGGEGGTGGEGKEKTGLGNCLNMELKEIEEPEKTEICTSYIWGMVSVII